MFEERDGLSDRISVVRSLVEKLFLNLNVVEWLTCMLGNLKNVVYGVRILGVSVEVK